MILQNVLNSSVKMIKVSHFFSTNNEERFAAKSLFIHPYSVQISKFRLLVFGIDSFYCITIIWQLIFANL